jgi:protein ImuB
MHRMLYVFLPGWAIDRLRRAGLLPHLKNGDKPGEEAPFATVTAAGGRQLLAAVNALSFLPGLATRPAEPAEDEAALRRLAEWCGRYSPWTAPDGIDGVKIEITGSAHLWGGEADLAADLSRRLARQGITHRLAIADTIGAAWAVARCAGREAAGSACFLPAKSGGTGGLIVPPDSARDAIAPLPIAALRLDPALVQGLHRVGLRRVGEVINMPRDALARRFGEDIGRRLDQALGHLPEPLSPLGEAPTRRVRLSFAEPISDPADLARAVERLTQDLVARLAREGMGARRLDLGFHRVDGRVERIRIGTARPSRDPVHLAKLMIAKLDTIDPGLGVEDAILAVYAADTMPAEQPPLPASGERAGVRGSLGSDTAPLFDRIGARLGLDALARLEAQESHIPERGSVAVPVRDNPHPNPPPPAGEVSASARVGGQQNPPRPVRLFVPPEPVEAFWVLPDDPPFNFTWRRRPHRVARADGPERIAEEWWRPDGPAPGDIAAADAIRDYYRVEDETGRRFWLFRAGLPGDPPPRWFVHGILA